MPHRELLLLTAVYFPVVSAVSVGFVVWDKRASKIPGRRRIPERTLLLLAAAGGGISMYVAMFIVRHKTRRPKFMIGIPAILIAEYGAFLFIYNFMR